MNITGTASNDECEQPGVPDNPNKEANLRAYRLLKETIGETLFMELVANKVFEVQGKYGMYAIDIKGQVALRQNVQIGEKTRPIIWGLCVGTTNLNLPEADQILSLYLSITKDEDNFVKTANFRKARTKDEFHERNGECRPNEECQADVPRRVRMATLGEAERNGG